MYPKCLPYKVNEVDEDLASYNLGLCVGGTFNMVEKYMVDGDCSLIGKRNCYLNFWMIFLSLKIVR